MLPAILIFGRNSCTLPLVLLTQYMLKSSEHPQTHNTAPSSVHLLSVHRCFQLGQPTLAAACQCQMRMAQYYQHPIMAQIPLLIYTCTGM